MTVQKYVSEFHEAFNLTQNIEFAPGTPEFRLRCKLLTEETLETLDARTRTNLVKELADVVYVAYGTALTYGIDLDEAIRLVHESNMSKLDNGKPLFREDGKVLKGPDYREPNLDHL